MAFIVPRQMRKKAEAVSLLAKPPLVVALVGVAVITNTAPPSVGLVEVSQVMMAVIQPHQWGWLELQVKVMQVVMALEPTGLLEAAVAPVALVEMLAELLEGLVVLRLIQTFPAVVLPTQAEAEAEAVALLAVSGVV